MHFGKYHSLLYCSYSVWWLFWVASCSVSKKWRTWYQKTILVLLLLGFEGIEGDIVVASQIIKKANYFSFFIWLNRLQIPKKSPDLMIFTFHTIHRTQDIQDKSIVLWRLFESLPLSFVQLLLASNADSLKRQNNFSVAGERGCSAKNPSKTVIGLNSWWENRKLESELEK